MAKKLQLNKGFAIVDDEDFEILSQWKWCVNPDGYAIRKAYFKMVDGVQKNVTIRMHRQVMDAPNGLDVDHINGDRLDNRRCNLRLCTRSDNHKNRRKAEGKSSEYKGVNYRKDRQCWRASIKVAGKETYLGAFANEREAAVAYNSAAIKYFGEFARINAI